MQNEPSQAELWNNVSENWRIQEEGAKPVYETIISTLDIAEGRSVLDIGCGTGYFLSLLAPYTAELTGVDIAASQLDVAKRYLPTATFTVAGMEALPFPDASFDFIVANNSVQFSPDTDKALAEIYRVLKPGGKFVVTLWDEPRKSEAFAYFEVFYSITGQPMETSIPFNLSKNGLINELLQKAGFKVIAAQPVVYSRTYPDTDTAVKAILASGPAINAIGKSSREVVAQRVTDVIQKYKHADGSYSIKNAFVFTTTEKPGI